MAEQTGLRERKKAATKAALSHAAMRLAVEKGDIDAVTAEEIAAEAGVSVRTFHNYFQHKEAALLHDFNEITAQTVADIRERARHQPLWEALRDACIDMRIDERFDFEVQRCREQLLHASPSLVSHQAAQFLDFFSRALDVVAESTGADEHDMYPRLILGAALVALKVAHEHWLAHPDEAPLAEVIADAFEQFAVGVTRPTTTSE